MPALNQLAQKTFGGGTYADLVHFVHVYTVEAHPKAPDPSPYSGKVWEAAYSSKPNSKTYPGRVANAKDMEQLLQGNQRLLVDSLTPEPLDNPVWCTYGTCPNCSFLIKRDGKIHQVLQKTANNLATLETAIKGLLQ